MKKQLPVSEELDFHYLLSLLPPLYNVPGYAWLPELFSIVGVDSLLLLCKYAGGETITIPTLDQLSHSVLSMQWFYNVYIAKRIAVSDIPDEYLETVQKIHAVYKDQV